MKKTIPYTVIGGYLGAGKTTLLNHLLRESRGMRLAVMVNDFGDINIDADLVTSHDGETINLASGCICCSLADGFLIALNRLSKRWGEIDHIVVEASGVSDPVKIGHYGAILSLDLEGVIVLVDAEQIRTKAANKFVGDTVIRQLQGADLLVINKVDLVSSTELASVRAWLAELAPAARIVETKYGLVPTALLLGTFSHPRLPTGEAYPGELEHDHTHESIHDEMYETASITLDAPVPRAALESLLSTLPDGILRAKGFVYLENDPDLRYVLQLVGHRWKLTAGEPWGDAQPQTLLVWIGLPGSIDTAMFQQALCG